MSHDAKLNLHQRLLNVMKAVGYVKKDVDVSKAKGVARDAVVAEIRNALLDNGVIVSTSQVSGRYIENTQKSSSGTPLTIYSGTYRTTFVNVDEPTQTLSVEHEAQGNDYGDKSPGKAATYAEKLNLVKGLLLETGISDEGRNPGEGDGGGAGFTPDRVTALKKWMASSTTADDLKTAMKASMAEAKDAGNDAAYADLLEYGKGLHAKLKPAVAMPSEKKDPVADEAQKDALGAPAENPDAEGADTEAAAKRGPPASATMLKMLRKVIAGTDGKVTEEQVAAKFVVADLGLLDKVEVAAAIKFVNGATA